jgi:hypothetical protein
MQLKSSEKRQRENNLIKSRSVNSRQNTWSKTFCFFQSVVVATCAKPVVSVDRCLKNFDRRNSIRTLISLSVFHFRPVTVFTTLHFVLLMNGTNEIDCLVPGKPFQPGVM